MAYDGGSSVRRRRRSGGAANPLAIFGSRLMLWNDWSDISTLYQDSAFSTPVAALNDPIGGVRDKSGKGNHATQGTSASRPLWSARVNLLTYSEQFDNAAWLKIKSGTGVIPVITANAGTAPDGTSTADRAQFSLGGGTTSGDISRLFQDVADPATGTGTWAVYLRSYDGASTYTMRMWNGSTESNITVTGTWQRFELISVSAVINAQIGLRGDQSSATADVLVWGADLRVTNVGVGLSAYQRIGAATDYDTTGFPFYASLDGTDDSWATSAIDFSASDKIAVFAAVRKLADTTGFIAELSANSSTGNNGTFAVYSQTSDLYVRSGGTTRVSLPGNGGATNSPAPITRVVSNIGDISAPSLRNLVNGSQANIDTTSQGTGNFGNYPLYLGGRAGISNFFKGAVYQLFIVRGAVTAAEIAAANAYCNIKSKAY